MQANKIGFWAVVRGNGGPSSAHTAEMDRVTTIDRLANSYLDHIRVAVEAQDFGAPFRDFIDNWAAFASATNHHRTASNKVIWFNNPDALRRGAMLRSLPFRSVTADNVIRLATDQPETYRQRQLSKDPTVRLIVDHAVPLAVLVRKLFETDFDLSRNCLKVFLERNYHLGLLTAAEDCRLNQLGLRSTMPANWDGADLIARYRNAGIDPWVG